MTYHTTACSWPCEGTSALAAQPRLVLIEGGRTPETAPVRHARTARREVPSALTARQSAVALLAGVLVVAAVVLASLASDALSARQAATSLAGAPTETVVVRPGETLWEIASAHTLPGVSASQALSWIEEANGLAGGLVQPGETLMVPVG